jgi:tetratricopeptide (TPR) repeat protein
MTPKLLQSALRGSARYIALLTGLIFVVHPVQTEAVTYIFQRFASLMTLFYLLSMLTYVRWRMRVEGEGRFGLRGAALYVVSLLSAVLAMKTKENAFTLPLMVFMYEFFFFNGGRFGVGTRVLRLVPLLLGPGDWFAEVSSMAGYGDLSRWDYFLTQYRVLLTYVRLIFFPSDQNINYNYPIYESFFKPQVFVSFLVFVALVSLAAYMTYRSRSKNPTLRLAAFGIFWFIIALSVESTLVPLRMLITEYRVYLPSVGAFAAMATGSVFLIGRIRYEKVALFVTVCAVPVVLGSATYFRNSIWGCEIRLWEDTARKSPENALVHNNLALAYRSKGLITNAISHFRKSLQIMPDNPGVHNNLAVAYMSRGLTDMALRHYRKALMLKPEMELAHNNLGIIYYDQGEVEKALKHYRNALRLRPDFTEAHNNIGLAYRAKGMSGKAEKHFRLAMRLEPEYKKAHYNLGLLYFEDGFMDKANEMMENALRLDPDYGNARALQETILQETNVP